MLTYVKGGSMSERSVKSLEALPVVLTMKDVQDTLGLCKPTTYALAHTQGFPVVKFGKAFRVPREAFIRWLNEQAGAGRA